MLGGLILAGVALRAGLGMRRRRLGQSSASKGGLLKAHLRVAKPAVVVLLAGFMLGPLSALWLRDWSPFGTLHAWLGVLAAALFGGAGWMGRDLERHRTPGGRGEAARTHGLVGALAMLAGAVAAAAGMVLLP
jgi:hypothetical protein